jgi:hypothetical protein
VDVFFFQFRGTDNARTYYRNNLDVGSDNYGQKKYIYQSKGNLFINQGKATTKTNLDHLSLKHDSSSFNNGRFSL